MSEIDRWVQLMRSNQARVNARLAAEGRCVMHNSDINIPAEHLVELPIGNVLPLCAPCCAQWLVDAKEDAAMAPVCIGDLRPDTPEADPT